MLKFINEVKLALDSSFRRRPESIRSMRRPMHAFYGFRLSPEVVSPSGRNDEFTGWHRYLKLRNN